MDKWKKIWVLEHFDVTDDVWVPVAYFSSREKAEEYYDTLRKEEGDIYDETSEFRYEWHYIDKGYFDSAYA